MDTAIVLFVVLGLMVTAVSLFGHACLKLVRDNTARREDAVLTALNTMTGALDNAYGKILVFSEEGRRDRESERTIESLSRELEHAREKLTMLLSSKGFDPVPVPDNTAPREDDGSITVGRFSDSVNGSAE